MPYHCNTPGLDSYLLLRCPSPDGNIGMEGNLFINRYSTESEGRGEQGGLKSLL